MGNQIISRIRPEIGIETSRSGGPGGQHANKVETRVVLRLNIPKSSRLTSSEKEKLLEKLNSKLSKEGELLISADSHRSQSKNKEIAFKKLHRTLANALKPEKKRKKTKPGKAAIEKRLNQKKKQSEKKKLRRKFSK